MNTIKTLVRLIAGCSHQDTYRERRQLDGLDVMHLVCHDCGHAVPAIQRTTAEHAEMLAVGAVQMPKARRRISRVIIRKSA
jgi:hypothetical protein